MIIRKRDINDWLLWVMVFRLFIGKHGLIGFGLCLLVADFLYAVTNIIIDERMDDKR